MLQTKQLKLMLTASEARDAIPIDIWVAAIAEPLETRDICTGRAVCKAWQLIFSADDLWLNKLTRLALQFPVLSDLDNGAEESSYDWYKRCFASSAWCPSPLLQMLPSEPCRRGGAARDERVARLAGGLRGSGCGSG